LRPFGLTFDRNAITISKLSLDRTFRDEVGSNAVFRARRTTLSLDRERGDVMRDEGPDDREKLCS